MKYCTINKFFLKIAFLLFIALSISAVNAQTKGLIVERATGAGAVVLDPNGDGYSSRTTGGFFTDDQIESEIPYSSLVFPALEPTSDLSAGPNCSFTDFVDQGDQDPAQAYLDSNGNWMFRLRMGSTRPNAKSYSILIDTDGKFGGTGPNADPQYSSSNPGFEIEIVLATKFGVYVYDVNNMNCTPVISYTGTTNYQKSIALTEVCGDADYFYDFFVKMSDLTTYFATASPASTTINSSTAMRMAIVDNMAALKSTLCNPASASDIAGVDSNCGALENCFTTIIDNYTPCAPGVVCPDRSLCPTINGPIAAGATSISITTTEAIGTIIKVYNGPTTLIGTSVVTTTSPQTLNVTVAAVSSGNIIYATAQAPGQGASINNCNTVTVAAPCLTGALTGVSGNAKGICGGGLTSGATLRIYRNGILIHAVTASNSVIEITGTTWRFKPNGNFSNCTSGAANMATGYYEVSQVISGCEGPKVAYDNGTGCSGAATTPVIAGPSPIYAGTATISGTSGASASIQLYIGGVLNSTFTANGSGVWTSASVTVTAAQSVYVVATETGKCTSATSASVTVLTKPIPTILGSYCGSVTSVTGTVAAAAGTIQLYRSPSNVAVGSPVAISLNGTWTVTGLSLVSGNQIYATITFPQGTTSTSATTTIGNQTTNAVAITTPTILEGATTLSGTGISGDTITLYIDGTATIYTTTVNGSNNWTISPIPASEFYITALVSVTATTTGLCEGVPTASKTVQCVPPSVQTYTGGSKSYCFGNAGFISLGSSELGVIYQLVNSSGVSVGPSAVGTGSAINLFTNALTANLTNVFVRAYKLVSPTCSVTSLVQINFDTQLPSPSISLTSTNVSVLQGVTTAAFAFTNLLNTPTNYSIDFSIAAINAGFSNVGSTLLPASPINVVVPAAAPVGVYSAFLTITGGTACSSRYPITITVFAPSSAPIISSQPASADRCTGSGASFSITADSSLAITYRWEISTNGSTWLPIANGGVYSNATTSTLSISNVAGLDGYLYRGIATNTNGSATSVGATLNVNPLPTAFTVTGGGSYCSGGTGVAVGLANSTAGINYQLQLNGVDNGAAVAGTGSAISFGLKTAAGTYTAIATNATTACTLAMTGSAVITINPTPAVPTVVVTAPTCASAATNILSTYSASLTYTSTPSGLSVGAGGVITGGNNGTSYTITATNASLCSATTASFTFNGGAILETPAVPTVVVTSATCSSAATNIISNYSASLNYTSTPTGLSVGAGGVITGGNNGTSYTITATNASLCSATTASFTFNGGAILETPAVPTVVVTSATCSSAATNITSNYSASLNYTSTPTGLSVGAGGVITGGNNGTSYTITATNASLCSVNSASFNYDGGTILSTPAVPTVVVTSATCSSAATNIVSNYSASLNYTSTPTGLSVGAGGVITVGNNGTSYTITATNASLCSVNSASFNYDGGMILSTPAVPTVVVTAPTCASAATNILSTYSASLTYTSTPSGLSVGAGGVITGGNNGTSYTITATNASLCSATTASFTFNGGAILETPAVPTVLVTSATCSSAATNIVSNYSASLNYTSTPTGLSVGAGGVITGGNNGTSYTITATNASLCSVNSASFNYDGGTILSTPAVPTVVVTSATCSSAATNIVSNYSASLNYTSTPTGLSVGAGGVITGGNNGTSYTITATNASLCSVNSASFTYDGGTILSTPAVPTVVVTSTTCSSAATNIVSNYSASLNYTSTPTGLSVGAGGVITGGNNGTSYTITATNASLCSVNSASFNYDGGMILSTPAVPTVVVTSATCSSAATNIVSNYSSSLNYTSTPTGLSVGAGGVITGGNNGTSYTITATNASLCSVTTASFTFNGGAILATPTVFSVTGGGLYCSGGTGVAVGLANTTTGIIYQLQLNGVNSGTAVAGTGSAISFGLKTLAGTYTVIATNNTTSCTSAMTGSAVITICSGGSIAATVWYDTNGDGIVDVGENGLQGATVTLDPGTPSNATDDTITATDASGKYIFNNLPAGNYTVSINVSTITAGIPAGYNSAQLVPTFDADGVGTHNKSTITLVSGENNLNQNFAYVKPSDNTTGGHTGGVESESLGDAISKIYVGRKKNSVPTEFVKSSKNLFNKSTFKTLEAYKGKEQTLLDMFPKELVPGNIANETSPKDILDYTIADQVLSVDFSIGAKTKAVVLGIKTSDKIYNHTKASCDRLRGAEILNIQKIKIQGYNFLMQGIKQRNGVVEYAISFAVAKNNNDTSYSIQTNWYVNAYTKFNDVYNFQVWSTRPADTQKLVSDILNNLKSYMPVNLIGQQKIPETYASKVYREKGELIVKLRSTKVDNTAEISMVELYSETANNIKFRDNTLSTNIKQELRVDIADGYEYDGLIKVNSQVEDAFYHADGNWGLDYDKRYTKINNYFVWNNFDRKYSDEEYSINRNVEIKATSEYDYLTVYKSLLPGTLSADYSEYKYLSFTAKGSGLTELGLIKSSIEDWKSQYRIMVDLTATEQTYYIPFDAFISANSKESMIPNDLTTLTFTFLPVEAKTKELDMFISNVKFVKVAGNDGIVINKKLKFDNSFLAYPNPSKGKVNLMLFSNNDTNAIITLTDLLGRTIYKSSTDLKVGRNELDFNFNIPSGTYILNVSSKDTDYGTSKIIFR